MRSLAWLTLTACAVPGALPDARLPPIIPICPDCSLDPVGGELYIELERPLTSMRTWSLRVVDGAGRSQQLVGRVDAPVAVLDVRVDVGRVFDARRALFTAEDGLGATLTVDVPVL